MSDTFQGMIKDVEEENKSQQKMKKILIPPRYEAKIVRLAKMRGLELDRVEIMGKKVYAILTQSQGLVKKFLKGFGFNVIGFLKVHGVRYKFIGKYLKPDKRRIPIPILHRHFCKGCKRPVMNHETQLGKHFCKRCESGDNIILRNPKRVRKNHRKTNQEQERCLRSLLGSK